MEPMTYEEIGMTLMEESSGPKEIRAHDGRGVLVDAVERRALGGGRLVVMEGPEGKLNILSIRNIASIGVPPTRVPESRSA